jgi:hypothetical protein
MDLARSTVMLFTFVLAAASTSCAQLSRGPNGDSAVNLAPIEPNSTYEEGFGDDAAPGMRDDAGPAPTQRDGVPSTPPALMPGAPDVNSTIG